MRFVEVRRHSLTKKGEERERGSHLSQEGVELARQVGSGIGPFDRVYTSAVPRAAETALALGQAVDEELDELGRVPADVFRAVEHHEQWQWPEPFLEYARRIERSEALADFAGSQADLWRALGSRAPDGRAVLILTHGGILEPALVAALPGADHGTWGAPFSHCEGARLVLDGESFAGCEILRVESDPRVPEISLRRARHGDRFALARIIIDATRSAFLGRVPDHCLDWLGVEESATNWGRNFEEGGLPSGVHLFVAEAAHHDVIGLALADATDGVLDARLCEQFPRELRSLQVDPAWQRRGIGRRLISETARAMSQVGESKLLVRVLADNPNRAFYERLGARRVGSQPYDWNGYLTRELIYVWDDLDALRASS